MKKRLAIVLCLVMCLTMALPFVSSAAEFKDNLYFNADFRSGSAKETTGKFEEKVLGNGAIGEFEGETAFNAKDPAKPSGVRYTIKDGTVNMGQAFTLETYVYVRDKIGKPGAQDPNWGQEENFFMGFGGTGIVFADHNATYNDAGGFALEIHDGENGFGHSKYNDTLTNRNAWTHVVAVFDNGTVKIYVDGELAEMDAVENSTSAVDYSGIQSIWVGCRDDNKSKALNGYIAYARAYTAAATADEVADLYATSGDIIGGPSNPTPTKKPDGTNPGTFDMGILSLAAVALSSTALLKKKRG